MNKSIECLSELGAKNGISVPFERYLTTIKCYIEKRKRWWRLRKGAKFFDKNIALDSWKVAIIRRVSDVYGTDVNNRSSYCARILCLYRRLP